MELTEVQLGHLVYLLWRAPLLCYSLEQLHAPWDALIREGFVSISETAPSPSRFVGRVTDKGKAAVRALDLVQLVTICMREEAIHIAECLIKKAQPKQLPEFLVFDEPGCQSTYVRLFALERLGELACGTN